MSVTFSLTNGSDICYNILPLRNRNRKPRKRTDMLPDKLIQTCLIIAAIVALLVTLLPVYTLWDSPWLLVNIVSGPLLFTLVHRIVFDMLVNCFAEDDADA